MWINKLKMKVLKNLVKELYDLGYNPILVGEEVLTLKGVWDRRIEQFTFILTKKEIKKLKNEEKILSEYNSEIDVEGECVYLNIETVRMNIYAVFCVPKVYGIKEEPYKYEEINVYGLPVRVRPLSLIYKDFKRQKELLDGLKDRLGECNFETYTERRVKEVLSALQLYLGIEENES